MHDAPGVLRVFAHGSLLFRPGPLGGEAVPAMVPGWSRRLFHPSVRNWGRPAWPAPTSCLVPGGSVSGLVFEVRDPDGLVLADLVRREASSPIAVSAETARGTVDAVTWTMTSGWEGRPLGALVAAALTNVARGGGPYGDAREYVDGIARVLGAGADPHLDAFRSALSDAPVGPPGSTGR